MLQELDHNAHVTLRSCNSNVLRHNIATDYTAYVKRSVPICETIIHIIHCVDNSCCHVLCDELLHGYLGSQVLKKRA